MGDAQWCMYVRTNMNKKRLDTSGIQMVGTKHRLTPTCQRRILSSNISNSITAGARLKWSGERSRILPLLVALVDLWLKGGSPRAYLTNLPPAGLMSQPSEHMCLYFLQLVRTESQQLVLSVPSMRLHEYGCHTLLCFVDVFNVSMYFDVNLWKAQERFNFASL